MSRAGLALLALAITACTTPLQRGQRLYRDGDRLAALEVWRAAPENSPDYAAIVARVAVVEEEFDQLVLRYKKRARYFETKGRLAESILNYRLALKLQPNDLETLDHVQGLARDLAQRKTRLKGTYAAAMLEKDLPGARRDLGRLRRLDPFDPELESDQRQLNAALQAEISRLLAAGRLGFSMGNYAAAERAFHAVLQLEPANESARGHLSYIAVTRRESAAVGEAPFDAGTLASVAEIRAEGFYQNGLAAERGGELYAAIRYYQLALDANQQHSQSRKHLTGVREGLSSEVDTLIEAGRNQFRNEDLQPALDLWRRVLLIDPDNARAQAYVARAERQLQNLEQLRSEPDVAVKQE